MKISKFGKIFGVVVISGLYCGNLFAADTTITSRAKDIVDPFTLVMSYETNGTNTSNTQKVLLPDTDVFFLQISASSISRGTITPGLRVSLDNITYGSITATEVVQVTDTITTTVGNSGTGTTVLNAGAFRGTHTSAINTVLGVGTNTIRRYVVRPVGRYLEIQMIHTLSGTDTGKYTVSMSRAPSGAW